MANYRQIHTRIWKDDWFNDLTPEQKVLFIYLFSNEASSFTGLYPLSMRVMSFESGLDYGIITEVLNQFEQDHKVFYRDGVIWVVKMWQYHKTSSNTVKIRFEKDLEQIHDCPLKRAYLHYIDTGEIDIDTLSIPYVYGSLKKERKNKKEEEGDSSTSSLPSFQTGPEAIAERIYHKVTGHITIPSSERIPAVNVLMGYYNKYGTEDKAADALRPFWTEWRARKYKASNLMWLIDWAASGEIPEVYTGPAYNKDRNQKPTLAEQGYTDVTAERLARESTP